ncbi:hypothetical protein I552_4338 [Mycobacterium xenopi 3993]|nr:hypothetical protein I552_4338 [Mycobacterium xenopi 3993]
MRALLWRGTGPAPIVFVLTSVVARSMRSPGHLSWMMDL